MTSKAVKTVSEHNMFEKGDTVGVGLSGGADSVALLHFLKVNKDRFGVKNIKAVHIHHGIRGAEADRDLNFSISLCEKLNVELVSFHLDVPAEAEKTGEGIEECARRLRYDCFSRVECDKLATAHNLNDNAETFILNLTRGAALNGLCGIPYVRGKYIRPLLDCTRDEIEAYLQKNNLDFVTDSTNLCDDYTRNKIRHNILPQLAKINPAFLKAFSKCSGSLNETEDFLKDTANAYLLQSRKGDYYDCSVFHGCHNAVKNKIAALILKEQGVKNISREQISTVVKIIEKGGAVSLGGKITAVAERERLYFGKPQSVGDFSKTAELKNGIIKTPIGVFSINILDKKDLQNLNIKNIDKFIDCDKISNAAVFRNRREGDKYKPLRRNTKTLKKLFNESKTPVSVRDKMLILTDGDSIAWTELFGVGENYSSNENTKKFVEIIRMGEN